MFKYFSLENDERLFVCSETGETGIPDEAVHRLDRLREHCGFPFIINSGYRSPRHSIEASKDEPGEHTRGGVDIKVASGYQRGRIIKEAILMGYMGIGVAKEFVHVDKRPGPLVIWTY